MARQRLQKILAQAGLASRRHAEELIREGRVRVNGRIVTELGSGADARHDRIEVDGRRVVADPLVYLLLHKPRGVVTTASDPEGRVTVTDLVAGAGVRVFPVGRLDFATSGVLLLTNDGELTNGLLRPKQQVPKTYVVKLGKLMTDEQLGRWRKGVELADGVTLPAEVQLLRHDEQGKTWLRVGLHEGRNQQIRRMAEATGHVVMRLARIEFAGITCEGLRPGQWRHLTTDELRELKRRFGVPRRIRPAPEARLALPSPDRRQAGSRGGPNAPPRRAANAARPAPSGARAARSGRPGTKPRATGRRASPPPGRDRR